MMGQAECLKILKNNGWLTTKEIANKLNQKTSIVNSSLNRLAKYREVDFKWIKRDKHMLKIWKINKDY